MQNMRGIKRRFNSRGCQHIYQNTIGGTLLFYSDEDRLVFTTLFTVLAEKYDVGALSLTLMYNHTHSVILVESALIMAKFCGELASKYATAFNRDSGRKGPLFKKAYGNAPKNEDKKIRTAIAYSANNSVEKKLCALAQDDRWTFLAYLKSDHPFSEKIDIRTASFRMRKSLKRLKGLRSKSIPLSYPIIRGLFDGLDKKESEQLKDAIISAYMPISAQLLLRFYKDIDSMLLAINSNTGSEYDIREDYDDSSHLAYRDSLSIIARSSFADNPKSILTAPNAVKWQIADILCKMTGASMHPISKVLGLWSAGA